MAPTSDVIIIGGSLAGLMHAVVLKSLGRNVLVLEARNPKELQVRAAGLGLWPHVKTLINKYIPEVDLDPVAFSNPSMELRNGDGYKFGEIPLPNDTCTSSWAIIHRILLQACDNDVDVVSFEMGKRVCRVEEQGDLMAVTYKDSDGTEREVTAGLVIAADGARSFVRSQLIPELESEYAGYVAWRGSWAEDQVPEELKGATEGKLVQFVMEGHSILVYLTPGETGGTKAGKRLVEWCWYDYCDESSSTFDSFMTDVDGKRHNLTVPAEVLQPKTWETQLSRRADMVTPFWRELFAQSTKNGLPLLNAVRSVHNTKYSFYGGKLLLAGEAFMQVRPHLGASSSISALQAMVLGDVLEGKKTAEEAEKEIVDYAKDQFEGSEATGIFGMTGKYPEGHVPFWERT